MVRVLCRQRHSRTLWNGESVGHQPASHTTLFPSVSSFKARSLASFKQAVAGKRNRVTSMAARHFTTRPPTPLLSLSSCKSNLVRKTWGVPRPVADVCMCSVSEALVRRYERGDLPHALPRPGIEPGTFRASA